MTMPNRIEKLRLRCGRVVLPDRITNDALVTIEAGRITSISRDETIDGALDLGTTTLFPGFIDVHIHGAVGVDTMAATAQDLARVSEFLASQGVTGWLPTLVPAPQSDYEAAVQAIGESIDDQTEASGRIDRRGARVLGLHYEGPFVNTAQCGALRSDYFRSFSHSDELDDLPLPKSEGAVRMMTLAPEVEGGIGLISELIKRGWIVSLGHTRAEIDLLDRAFVAGAQHMTHFMNAMPPLHHRSPGPVGWALSRDDVTCDVIADGVHLDPFVLRVLLRLIGSDRLALISDAIAAAGSGDGSYKIWGETIAVKDRRTQNARGSIAGSVITMLDAVRTMLSVGASELAVARMAATNPSRLLRIDQDCGSIEEGKRGDLVALDGEGNVRLTVIGGSIAYESR